MEGRVVTKEDIIKEISEETGKDQKLILDIINDNLNRVDKLLNTDKEMLTLGFPSIGTFKANKVYHTELVRTASVTNRGVVSYRLELIKMLNSSGKFKSKSVLRSIVRNYGLSKIYRHKLVLKMQEIYKVLAKESEKINEEIYN